MTSDTEHLRYDGVGAAELVRRGDVTASELPDAAIRRAEAVNPRLNALVIPMYDIARELAARSPSGPFGGVPFLIKDLKQDFADVLASSGSRAQLGSWSEHCPGRLARSVVLISTSWMASVFPVNGRRGPLIGVCAGVRGGGSR
jgi:Amidase